MSSTTSVPTFSRCCSDLAEAEAQADERIIIINGLWTIHIHSIDYTLSTYPYHPLYTFSTVAFDNLEKILPKMRSTIVRLAAEATHSRIPMIHFLGKRANLEYSQSSYPGISLLYSLTHLEKKTQY